MDWKIIKFVTFVYKYIAYILFGVLDLWEATEHPGLHKPEINSLL